MYSKPYMMQILFTYIPIKSWIIDSNVDGFFNCPGNAMVLPPYYLEVILCSGVASVQLWLHIGEDSFRFSLNLSAKVLEVSPMYSSSQARSPHWNQ